GRDYLVEDGSTELQFLGYRFALALVLQDAQLGEPSNLHVCISGCLGLRLRLWRLRGCAVAFASERLLQPGGSMRRLHMLKLDNYLDRCTPPFARVAHVGVAEILDALRREAQVFFAAASKIGGRYAIAASARAFGCGK